jgi:acyl-coenzyme A synthetase/AMP-(fatty) acid ligase
VTTTLPWMLAEMAAQHRCFEYVELVDALPKTPKQRAQKYRLRTRGVEAVSDREAARDRLTR